MKKSLKKTITISLIITLAAHLVFMPDALAKKRKSKGLSEEDATQITTTIATLTKKIYASSLFSPADNADLIDIKIKLDTALEAGIKPELAPLYYKSGVIYKAREYRDEAIDCFQTVIDNFSDTPYALKAINELKKMGIKVESPATAGGQTTTPGGKP